MAGKNVNNRFRLFEDKTSLAKRFSRMLNGGDTSRKGNKLGWWERRQIERDTFSDILFELQARHVNRPDLVAFEVYGNAQLTWLVLQYNNIVDIELEFLAGKVITLPSPNRTFSNIVTENPEREPNVNE